MFITSDPANPVYLVSPDGDYVRDDAGKPRIFEGEAIETHSSGYLVDTQGNFLLKNNAYIPVSSSTNQEASQHTSPSPTTTTDTDTILTVTSPLPSENTAPTTIYPPAYYAPVHTQQTTFTTQSTSDDKDKKAGKRWALILVVILLALAVGTGGGFLAYQLFGSGSSESTENSDSTNTENPHSRDIVTSEPTTYIHLPPEVYQGAGSVDVPRGAISIDTGKIIISPTGNLACGFSDGGMLCQALNWESDKLYGNNPNECSEDYCYPYNGVTLDVDGHIELISGPGGVNGEGITMPYGNVAYSGNFVCASEENGITCWSRQSGHGFFINRDGYKPF